MAEFHQIEALFSEYSVPIQHSMMNEREDIRQISDNPFSSTEFRMIKIVERVLVTTSSGRKVFFPCEFQILTGQTLETVARQQLNHAAYEKRQINGVRKRLFRRNLIKRIAEATSLVTRRTPRWSYDTK